MLVPGSVGHLKQSWHDQILDRHTSTIPQSQQVSLSLSLCPFSLLLVGNGDVVIVPLESPNEFHRLGISCSLRPEIPWKIMQSYGRAPRKTCLQKQGSELR